MKQRTEMIEAIRGELVGPSVPLSDPQVINFVGRDFHDPVPLRRGPIVWVPTPDSDQEEVLYFERESPYRKYGVGLLHPMTSALVSEDQTAASSSDFCGADIGEEYPEELETDDSNSETLEIGEGISDTNSDSADDLEISSADVRKPCTMGLSLYAAIERGGEIRIQVPKERKFAWQEDGDKPLRVNGYYEACDRRWIDQYGNQRASKIWRRRSLVQSDVTVVFTRDELLDRKVLKKPVPVSNDTRLNLELRVYPRKSSHNENEWLLTVVLANISNSSTSTEEKEVTLYQSLFEVSVELGQIKPYPESGQNFEQLEDEDKSLNLLYRESATWGIGHGCAAGWEVEPEEPTDSVFADVLPAAELPSMTPDIKIDGIPIKLSMRSLSDLPDSLVGPGWDDLDSLSKGYRNWIIENENKIAALPENLRNVADSNLRSCMACYRRIDRGIDLLKKYPECRRAFELANLSMLLQQISTKQLGRRKLAWSSDIEMVAPDNQHLSPWQIFSDNSEDSSRLGSWRAFQIAFLLMSLEGLKDGAHIDRTIVDLIWFPTGGGKTEAYLGAMSFYMFYQRLMIDQSGGAELKLDGTNVLMRYTLRMLTTQQFQRAASLICGMEFIRRNATKIGIKPILGRRFSLGLWIGGEGSPNKIADARTQISKYKNAENSSEGNPLVLTECPWCRSQIGRFDGKKPKNLRIRDQEWKQRRIRGVYSDSQTEPMLYCPDSQCEYGQEQQEKWLPVEVIDERIYSNPPSLVISTADKLAMAAYRPNAGALFGRSHAVSPPRQVAAPPGLIVQDELHLISGPLGTMYALYEGIIEHLCTYEDENGVSIKPKIVASTATIRGAETQVKALYDRANTQLFPAPALTMGDTFFGKYARDGDGKLARGRLYLGIHGVDYGSILTAQVRAFSAALFRPWSFKAGDRDAWWTLLAFYNSIRELGGARTLFDSDIRSRLKFMFNREGFEHTNRRNLMVVEELTSRLSQSGIVNMMDRLSLPYEDADLYERIDACLASNIIEVGVDIDRLSMMGVVGQPKSTASYIQVTGRVGRRWWERPGLIMTLYSPAKSRDRSHYEQFHSYHRRLYEKVEPTTATPFAVSAIERGLAGALILIARQLCDSPVQNRQEYEDAINTGFDLLYERCKHVQLVEDRERSLSEMKRVRDQLLEKWGNSPQKWEEFPQKVDGDYLMLWPGQFATKLQQNKGVVVPSSMRQVDRSAELTITQGYTMPEDE